MTHSLHRCGRIQERDFVWLLYHVKGVNDDHLVERVRKAIGIVEEAGAVNWGDVKSGPIVSVSPAEIKEKLTEKSRIRGVFTSRDQVTEFLKKMKDADLGLCVVISGLLDQVFPACQEAGVRPHTINYSLGVFGKKELLAEDDTLAITTMCGHHMISDGFVAETRRRVKEGKISPEKASLKFAELCPCGIFNQERAKELLSLEKENLNVSGKKQ
ncbi:MAG: hypothetical protein HY882_00440 [Deltaproteobacteria bacterium]|nr:hypothetical protein [Deltaproteobacteria bacterium]